MPLSCHSNFNFYWLVCWGVLAKLMPSWMNLINWVEIDKNELNLIAWIRNLIEKNYQIWYSGLKWGRLTWVQFFWSEAFLSTAIYSYLYCIKILNENEKILSLIKFLLNCKRFWAVPKFNSIICKKFQFSGQKRCNFVDAFPKANVGENSAYKWINL